MKKNEEKVFIFGASNLGLKAYKILKKEYNVVAFIDNDFKKWGTLIKDKLIISPKDVCKNFKIIIASTYWREILVQIIKIIGISNFSVFLKNIENTACIINMEYKNNRLLINVPKDLGLLKSRKINLYKLKRNNLLYVKFKENISVNFINRCNAKDILDYRDEQVHDTFVKMLKENQLGLYVKYNGKVIGHAWCIVNKDINIVNDLFLMSQKTAMLHFCNVKEVFRGKNIYPYMLCNLITCVKEKFDIDNFYIWTEQDNLSSQKGLMKLGFKKKEQIEFQYYGNDCINIKSIFDEE